MIEQLLALVARYTGPGQTDLIAGNMTNGFYGEVSAAQFFTSTELAAAMGISSFGTMINDTTPWFKVSLDGRTYYTPKKALRCNMTWNVIDSAQYRTEAQNGRVTKNGNIYRVTMMTGIGSNWIGADGEDPAGCEGSQYNRIIYRLCALNPPREEPPVFGAYSLGDLGLLASDQGCAMMCQEQTGPSHLQRNGGGENSGSFSWHSLQKDLGNTATDNFRGWRPMLEFVGKV
jgi:hypothetical protein